MKKILFSPIGNTDPISGQHDGALLHIIRKYRPDKVYLYLSKEICDYEDEDNRYSFCLNKLKEFLDIDFEIEWIRRENLANVHIFDYFLTEFRDLLTKIYEKEQDAKIYLNVTSGTPAMESALQFLSSLYERPLIPVQVSTPEKGINKKEDDRREYDKELQWECNLDNEPGYEDRCSVSEVLNLTNEIRINMIKAHIDAYDYVAAARIIEPIKDYLNPVAVDLINAGVARLQLDKSTCSKLCEKARYDMYPVKTGDEWNIFEYLMVMYIKLKRKEYADFVRAISPLFTVLMERVINQSHQFDLNDYTKNDSNDKNVKLIRWDSEKCKKNSIISNSDIDTKNNKVVTTYDYAQIISKLNIDAKQQKLVKEIREIERNLRNPAAHSIIQVTEDVIERYTTKRLSPKSIFDKLKTLAKSTGIKIKDEDIETYDRLNEQIKEQIQRKKDY